MEARGKIVYEFEHAESLEALQARIEARRQRGWVTSGAPRQLAIQTAESTIDLRYCQTFYRYSDESISREPWIRQMV